ncbi:hypothetical protein, partial [Succinimonas sp.]|uniref:hypothetical protein n=1 Tax=Succinimonas sp. TaxID=1936151 RepID=UPI00386448D2
MPNITYYSLNGVMFGKWPGKSVRQKDGRITKAGQIHLGKVISREKQIFWKRSLGYYHFDTETLECSEVSPEDMPAAPAEQDGARKALPVIVDFGDAYFLDRLLRGIGYDAVLKSIACPNYATLRTMVMFYILDSGIPRDALAWYRQNYVSYLFPGANITSLRLTELLVSIGEPGSLRTFFRKHLEYVGASAGKEPCLLIDSSSASPDSAAGSSQRLLLAVQKGTGLPLCFECVPDDTGSIAHTHTLSRISAMLRELGYRPPCGSDSCSDKKAGAGQTGNFASPGAERFFALGRNYRSLRPSETSDENALRGHLLLAFIASFFSVLIKNRLDSTGETYLELPAASYNKSDEGSYEGRDIDRDKDSDEEDVFEIELESASGEARRLAKFLKQQAYPEIAGLSSRELFRELRGHKADVFPEIFIASAQTPRLRQLYEAFGIALPFHARRSGKEITPCDAEDIPLKDRVSRNLIFARKCFIASSEGQVRIKAIIEEKVREQEDQRGKPKKAPAAADLPESSGVPANPPEDPPQPKRKGGGRPKGAKNKKTLEREQRSRDGLEAPPVVRHTIGRPPGAKNKATLERERKIASGEIILPPKREPGRPKGSKDTSPR